MDAQELLDALRKKLGTRYQGELAEALGVSLQTLTNWKNSDKKLSVEQIAGAIAKSRQAAVKTSQYETIRPVVEFYGIERYRSRDDRKWQLFQANTFMRRDSRTSCWMPTASTSSTIPAGIPYTWAKPASKASGRK
ncbi:TPA: helix-turn-helix domain-containing protein [Pseudomonas aeruginosa]